MSLLFSAAALALVTTSPLPRGSIARGTGGRTGPLRMADGRTAVSSTASLPGTSPAAAYQTLASPANWPGLLLFCASAELLNGAKGGLLKKGATVEEFAGLVPPLGVRHRGSSNPRLADFARDHRPTRYGASGRTPQRART